MLRFFKDFIIYGFASILGKIAAVFLMPIYTNRISQEEYGVMALIMSVQGIIGLVSNLNIHSGIAREYYEEEIDRTKLVSTGFYSILGISSLIFLFMASTQSFWQERVLGIDTRYSTSFLLMLLSIPTASLMSYFSILTRYKKKPILYSIGTLIQLFIQITISVVGVVYLNYGIVSLFTGIICGEIFGIIYYSYINRSNINLTFKKEYLKKALLFSIPTLPAIVAGWIDTSMGQIIIGKYISKTDLGVYSIALQLTSVFTFISIALHNVWGPFLYENYKKENFIQETKKLYITIVLILTLIASTVSIFSKEIVLLLSNNLYLRASSYFILLCIPRCIHLLFPIATSGISISRDTKYIAISYIFGSMMNLLFMFILLPTFGIVAVPISLGISRISTFFTAYYISNKKGIITLPNRIIFIFITTILVCYYLNNLQLNFGTKFSIAAIIITTILVYIKKINAIDIMAAIKKRKKSIN